MPKSFFRYPGGKSQLAPQIMAYLKKAVEEHGLQKFADLTCGGGSTAIAYAEHYPEHRIALNDFDLGIYSLWRLVVEDPDYLIERVRAFCPTKDQSSRRRLAAQFYEFQAALAGSMGWRERGFKKLAIHQISYSGLGAKAGSPIGGRDQKGEYPVFCRWNPEHIERRVRDLHKRFKGRTAVTHSDILSRPLAPDTISYIDPPYYVAGGQLYKHAFGEVEHARLAELLRTSPFWVLSYDAAPQIRKLYRWAEIAECTLSYGIRARTGAEELIIRPK